MNIFSVPALCSLRTSSLPSPWRLPDSPWETRSGQGVDRVLWQLALVTPIFGHKVGHLAASFLPSEVLILKFRIAHFCPRGGNIMGTRGACISFEAWERRILMHSVPFPRVGILGAWGLVMSYFIVYLLFRWYFLLSSVPVPVVPVVFWGVPILQFFIYIINY